MLMRKLGKILTQLTWAEMDSLAANIVDEVDTVTRLGEDVNSYCIASLLSEIGRTLVEEAGEGES
jgi:hypothetical protein|tara:strand:+ start:1279 stop:1473 length:195 start_codon:yes stop_codon:yes gene_type:complete